MEDTAPKIIYLADDDMDDCILFEDALREICNQTQLFMAKDGEFLMKALHGISAYPDMIFLDLNMPCKNGFECLQEIRGNEKLKHIPVIMFSTTAQEQSVIQAYHGGANFYVKKPVTFSELKDVIQKMLQVNWRSLPSRPPIDRFLVGPDTTI